jgi:hypothetical protein
MSKSTETAKAILAAATGYGWSVFVRGSILTITKAFTANSNDELVKADMEYYSILDLLPATSAGSVWGTDCGGMGAMSALTSGQFKMNKSGGSKLVLNAIKKIQG